MTDGAISVFIPRDTVNDEFARLVAWRAAEGERVDAGRVVAEVETSKAVLEIEAPAAGYARLSHKEGAEIPIGAVLFYITRSPDDPIAEAAAVADAPRRTEASSETKFSRKALALLEQHRLDPKLFAHRQMVKESDVLALLGAAGTAPKGRPAADPAGGAFRKEPLSRMKRLEVKYLTAGNVGALVSVVSVACPTRGLRAAVAAAEDSPFGGSATALIVYEVAKLLKKHPVFNAFYEEGSIHFYEAVNIGLAVDAEKGLKVPVIHDADKKEARVVAREIEDVLLDYHGDQLKVASLSGGTFTITDLSAEGVFYVQPLINQRQAAILGVGAEFIPPSGGEGFFQLILAFDHRLSEGRKAAQFLRDLRDRLEGYERALAGGRGKSDDSISCSQCLRPASELAAMRAHLVQTVKADGGRTLVCAFCLSGY